MTRQQLYQNILKKQSYLCIGLDPDLDRLPKHLLGLEDPIFEFNKVIIDATQDLCVAYKPNLAFYEALGSKGWVAFEKTVDYISENHFIIADAKRGDIGNTSKKYAKAFFEQLPCDGLTIAPYMGSDSVTPFLEFEEKWVILLALTSNKGSQDFQFIQENGEFLHEKVLQMASQWGTPDNLMFVVGATHPEQFRRIRELVPEHFLLVPGVGTQGGNLKRISEYGMNGQCGLLVNSSRGIIYAGNGKGFAEKVRAAAQKIQSEMQELLKNK